MLPAAYRLRSRKEFEAVYAASFVVHTRLFKIVVGKAPVEQTRFGVVVSNKTAQHAVDRNRKKRQIRAILAKYMHSAQPRSVIIIVKPPAVAAESALMQQDIEYGLKKAKVI